jgi:hypothetical protein
MRLLAGFWSVERIPMAYSFLPCNRSQAYLLPPSLTDWLPDGHRA